MKLRAARNKNLPGETPEALEIYEIGEDYLLGKVEGELGVDYIQLWALNRRGGPG